MKNLFLVAMLACLWMLSGTARSQASCPPGWIPYSSSPQMSSCGPAPTSQQQGAQPSAPPIRWESQWGAIVIDEAPTNVGIGVSQGKATQDEAVNAALADCRAKGGAGCKLNLAYGNQCAALVAGIHYARGQPAATIEEASAQGMEKCQAAGVASCTVYYSACNLPKRMK